MENSRNVQNVLSDNETDNGCMNPKIIMHEFLHAVGLYHTQVMLVHRILRHCGRGWGAGGGGLGVSARFHISY